MSFQHITRVEVLREQSYSRTTGKVHLKCRGILSCGHWVELTVIPRGLLHCMLCSIDEHVKQVTEVLKRDGVSVYIAPDD